MLIYYVLSSLFLIYDLAWLVLADRRLVHARAPIWARLLNLLFSLLMIAGVLVVMYIPRELSREIQLYFPSFYTGTIFIWHLLMAPIGLFFISTEAGMSWIESRLFSRRRFAPDPSTPDAEPGPAGMTRRQVLTAAAVAVPPLALGVTTVVGIQQVGTVRVRAIDVPVRGLRPEHAGLKVAHITDTHYGRFTGNRFTQAIIDAVRQIEPDMHLVTGDLIDSSLHDLTPGLDMLNRLKPGVPTYLCVGNHDLFMSRHGFIEQVKNAGVNLLVDDRVILDIKGAPIQVYGMDWYRQDHEFATAAQFLFRDHERATTSLLLAHHPHAFDAARPFGIDLTLAGHTHGGQLMLTDRVGAGALMYRYWSGLYSVSGSHLAVSNGVGNWFPLRVNAPAEVLALTLVPA